MNASRALLDRRRLLPWLLVLFIGSGCAALIYEIVWLQLLQLVIGLTNVSLGVLLGTYMGGMCLGSLLLPRWVSRAHHPLRVYALLEFGIALIGISIRFVLPWIAQVYSESVGRGLPGLLLREGVAALCLLPPTMLMGATLPAVARWVEMEPEGVSWLGFFYGGNIAGAVVGCLGAGFYLLPAYDMPTATYVAASLNCAVGAFGLILAGRSRGGTRAAGETDMASDSLIVEERAGNFDPRRKEWASPGAKGLEVGARSGSVYGTIALSGMAALGAEVVWTRLLSLIMGGTVYTFSIILAVFLVGLGIGSTLGSFLARSSMRPRALLGGCQILLVAAIAWTASMIACSLPYWPVNPALALSPWYTFQLDLARTFWAILPPALLWGASFPLALAALASRGGDSGRLVGRVYAANTAGAIAGAIGMSLLIVPGLGTRTAQQLLIVVSAVGGLWMLLPPVWRRPMIHGEEGVPRWSWAARLVTLTAAGGLSALLVWSVPAVPWGIVAYGRFMATYGARLAPGIRSEAAVPLGDISPDIYCTYLGEGLNGTVAVTKWTSGVRNFHSAGKVQASTEPRDMRLQRMLGHLSALAHPQPESVLVVACGAGVTAGTFVLHPQIKRIVICDIEPLVPKVVAPLFAKENYDVVHDLRTQVVSDDGRHFIRTTQEKFDIITSDPIDPWVKGCAALNTVEYYESCKRHLKPGGVMSLWIPLYESNPETVKSVIATFFKVFPQGIVWSNDSDGEGYDAVLFGQAEPSHFDIDQLQERLDRSDHSRVKQSLAEVGFRSIQALLSTYAGQASDLRAWTQNAQVNTDSNLRLQYLAGMSCNDYMGSEILGQITRYRRFPDELFGGSEMHKRMLKLRLSGLQALQNERTLGLPPTSPSAADQPTDARPGPSPN